MWVLRACCEQLQRLSLRGPVTILTVQKTGSAYEAYCALLFPTADEVIQPVIKEPFVWQPTLF
jgi:hypothetical protein